MPTVARLVELAGIFQCEASDLLTLASNRASDQARHLDQMLVRLDGDDRIMIVEMVEKLATRLAKE